MLQHPAWTNWSVIIFNFININNRLLFSDYSKDKVWSLDRLHNWRPVCPINDQTLIGRNESCTEEAVRHTYLNESQNRGKRGTTIEVQSFSTRGLYVFVGGGKRSQRTAVRITPPYLENRNARPSLLWRDCKAETVGRERRAMTAQLRFRRVDRWNCMSTMDSKLMQKLSCATCTANSIQPKVVTTHHRPM
jgi:hypothetical protein